VICAVPLNGLSAVTFSPPLSAAKKALLRYSAVGNLIKVFVFYREAFWLKAEFSGEVVSDGGAFRLEGCKSGFASIFYDATTEGGTPALVGFAAVRAADQWLSKTKEDRKESVVRQLADYFGHEAVDPLDYVEKVWTEEESIGGAPVVRVNPGGMHAFADGLRSPHGRVFFAGTETAVQWCGYMSGAVQAGLKAAADVTRAIDASKMEAGDWKVVAEYDCEPVDYSRIGRARVKRKGRRCVLL